jgi:uncharacterized protein YndB with AHSA1/START domain
MPEPSAVHSTFVIERNYPAPPERVFAAFATPATKRRWFVDSSDNYDVDLFEVDFREGGWERASYRFKPSTPFPGVTLASETIYHDIQPNRRIVFGSTMSFAGRRISAAQVTIELIPTATGTTDLICTHQAAFFEGADGAQMREAGWRKLLEHLAGDLAK